MSKTTTTPRKKAAAKAPTPSKRQAQRAISADTIRALCVLKTDERVDAQRRFDKANEDFIKEAQAQDKRHSELSELYEQAAADVEAHADYLKPGGPVERGELTRKEYDAEHRELQDAAEAAKTARDGSREEVQKALAPFRKELQEAQKLTQDLERQWKFHERRATEADVDVSDLWKPGKPLPKDEDDGAEA